MPNSNPTLTNPRCPLIHDLGARFASVQGKDGKTCLFLYRAEGGFGEGRDTVQEGITLLRCCGGCLKCANPEPILAWHELQPLGFPANKYLGMETQGMSLPVVQTDAEV